MSKYGFQVDKQYSRKDLYQIIGVPEVQQGGNWNTGYNKYNDDFFIFMNIGIPGRTGHDYKNQFIGDTLLWEAKNDTHLGQHQIQELLNPPGFIYIFYRTDNSLPFTYAGTGISKEHFNTTPVKIIWQILGDYTDYELTKKQVDSLSEGKKKVIISNVYERNPQARKDCIDSYGYACKGCGFDFKEKYGDAGENFIHVHHKTPISEIGEEYIVDPIRDLIPICPNCHAIIHRKKPHMTIEELHKILKIE